MSVVWNPASVVHRPAAQELGNAVADPKGVATMVGERAECTMHCACRRVPVGFATGSDLGHPHEPVVLGEVVEVLRVGGREWQLPDQAAHGDLRVVDLPWPAAMR